MVEMRRCAPLLTMRSWDGSLRRRAVGGQHFAGEIERAGDQDARRRTQVELARDVEGAFEIVSGHRRKGDITRDVGELGGRHGLVLMNGYGNDAARKAGKVFQKTGAVLG